MSTESWGAFTDRRHLVDWSEVHQESHRKKVLREHGLEDYLAGPPPEDDPYVDTRQGRLDEFLEVDDA